MPKDIAYKHQFTWEQNNGFSHVRAYLMGTSLVIPIANRRLVEFDNRARSRQVTLQFMGE